MIQEVINKLKFKKRKLEKVATDLTETTIPNVSFKIVLSNEADFFKMKISDYISIADYVERMQEIDNLGIEALVCTAVLWNSSKQKVNRGIYYILPVENRLYNILIRDDYCIIDERIKINDITEEKILSFNSENTDYGYTFHKHDQTGDTFYTRYYNKRGYSFGKLDLSTEEFLESINLLVSNLENIREIESIINLELLRKTIINNPEKTKKL